MRLAKPIGCLADVTMLEDDFHHAMIDLYEVAKASDFFATTFKQMLDQYGGVAAVQRLLAKPEIQPGLMRICELRLLDRSVEATVLQEGFQILFTQAERSEARTRLEELGYFK
jgi:hypothetical protein